MKTITLIFGCTVKPDRYHTINGSAFLEATQQRNMPLAMTEPGSALDATYPVIWFYERIFGLVVAANWHAHTIWPVAEFPVEPGNPPAPMDIICNLGIAGMQQAMTDWELLRLAASVNGFELDPGRLYLVYDGEDDEAEDEEAEAVIEYDEDVQYCDSCGQQLEAGRIGFCDNCIAMHGGARSEYDAPDQLEPISIPEAIEAISTLIAQEEERIDDDYSGIFADDVAAHEARRGLRALQLAREILRAALDESR